MRGKLLYKIEITQLRNIVFVVSHRVCHVESSKYPKTYLLLTDMCRIKCNTETQTVLKLFHCQLWQVRSEQEIQGGILYKAIVEGNLAHIIQKRRSSRNLGISGISASSFVPPQ